MKKILILSLILAASSTLKSQTKADIFNKNDYQFIYFGIDYSHAKFIGDFSIFAEAGEASANKIKSSYFGAWNGVVYKERDKYNLEEALRKEEISYNIDIASKINMLTVVEEMEANFAEKLDPTQIQKFVKEYDLGSVNDGVGIIFIAEYLNKNIEDACFHFVIFNVSTREVLIQKRYINEPRGFGLTNYWIHPIYKTIKEVDDDYSKWKQASTD